MRFDCIVFETSFHSYADNTKPLFFIYRLDIDQSARRNAQQYLNVIDDEYYEFEGKLWRHVLCISYQCYIS